MEERKINISTNDDQTPVNLSSDGTKALLKSIKDINGAVSYMHELIGKNNLKKGMSETLSSLLESHLKDIHTALEYDSVLKKEYDERYREIRKANRQNHELRKQLGLKVSAEDVRECLKNMEQTIKNWWKAEGMGFVKDVEFGPYSVRAKLSCSEGMGVDADDLKLLMDKGYAIGGERRSLAFLATKSNMDLLSEELTKAFPSANLFRGEVWFERNSGGDNVMWEVSITIRNYEDVLNSEYAEKE